MIVTIDGPAGSGKSTVSRLLAERLGVRFLDTGAMYRAVTLAVLRANVAPDHEVSVARIASSVELEFRDHCLLMNGEDVSQAIRSPEVSAVSSVVASQPAVRNRLVELQKAIGQQGSLVTEGRDQGSVVFPNAEFKFFLTADLDARAHRRQAELLSRGGDVPLEQVREEIRDRDYRDETRAVAPLKPAADAVLIDTSPMTIPQVVEEMLRIIWKK
ncbi:MAG: (d)CMP kinase [Planctomyces sp.]|nr:(d)CMP kinase [Planctomyces sp.]